MTAAPSAGRHIWAVALLIALSTTLASAQAPIAQPANNFTPAEEVALGREAASVLRTQLPLLADPQVTGRINDLGRRLVAAVPEPFRQPGFEYQFTVLNVKDVTSFALPGGPVFISRAAIDLAKTDGALAGVIAHELSHVLLRHAGAQVTAGEQYQIGEIAGRAVANALHGRMAGVMERAAGFAVSSYYVMYDPKFEQQADLVAAQITARAGFDPQEGALFMQAIKAKGGHRGRPVWEKSHDPRAERPIGTVGYSVVVPSGESRSATAGDRLLLSVPANWRRLIAGNTVIFAPEGAYLDLRDGPAALTHGVQVGLARAVTGSLEGDLRMLLLSLGDNNPRLTWTPAHQALTIAGRPALTTAISNVSPVTGEFESVSVTALRLDEGDNFLFLIGVAPQDDAGLYRNAFNRIVESLQIFN